MADQLSTTDIDTILTTIESLGLDLSPEQRDYLLKQYHSVSAADPKRALEIIFAEIERLAGKKLELKDKEALERAQKRDRWLKLLHKEQVEETPAVKRPKRKKYFSDDKARIIAKTAAEKLKIQLNEKQLKEAADYLQKESKHGASPRERANTALLGVIMVGIAGGVRIVVQYNWGNLINYPDLSPYHGYAPIDQADRVDNTFGDPTGAEFRAACNVLRDGAINVGLAKYLRNTPEAKAYRAAEAESQGTNKSSAPTLKPHNPFSTNPYDD